MLGRAAKSVVVRQARVQYEQQQHQWPPYLPTDLGDEERCCR